MNIKTQFPHPIREIENAWVPLADGTRLAARIWLPQDAERNPVPALLEYLPYRKSDGTAVRDAIRHPYLAGHGYAAIRVDMRGSGDADGILHDEYLRQEQDDALELLAWIAEQRWCNGRIGMFGKSWGGFNSLQIAARRPPQIKAIIPMHFTDDRYADDVHYMGGCVLGSQMLAWASTMFVYNALSPDPRWVGDRWREIWLNRLSQTPPFVEEWLRHQHRDAYWQHGSVCEDYSAIQCPVYAIGGWADAYTNAVPRLLAGLTAPKKGLIGPWAHNFPEDGRPDPAIGFLQESLRWWDYWLKEIETGIMDEPMLRVWLMESARPSTHHPIWPGRWVAESAWPSPHITPHRLFLQDGDLVENGRATAPISFTSPQTVGLTAGEWCPQGAPGDFAADQREEDARSLTFTTPPLPERMEILGYPEVTLTIAADQPRAIIAARLCDVHPDGASTLVSWGLLNLTHRQSHENPTPLEPGRPYSITLRLNATAYALPAGHRWRLALSPTWWPHAWPAPVPVTLTLHPGGELHLPVRLPRAEDATLRPFPPPESAPLYPLDVLRPAQNRRELHRDLITGMATLEIEVDDGRIRFRDNGLEQESINRDSFTIHEDDPLTAVAISERMVILQRGDWHIRVQTLSHMSADLTHFHVSNTLHATEGADLVFDHTWNFSIAREEGRL